MANPQQRPSLVRLVLALREEKIRFMIAGMSAAVIQGAPVVTFDTDIWIDLPSRHYMRPANLCLKLGAVMRANTVFVFPDDTMVNFLYAVTGLKSFSAEYKGARRLNWMGIRNVPVLPLERIHQSKSAVGRPKDLAHLSVLEQLMECDKRVAVGSKRNSKLKPKQPKA